MDTFLKSKWFVIFIITALVVQLVKELRACNKPTSTAASETTQPGYWVAPSLYVEPIREGEDRQQVILGQDIIANTSKYLGPNGSVAQITNGMNCQNCHLNAGSNPFGNNYGAVAFTYPSRPVYSGS